MNERDKIGLASENYTVVHPLVMEALLKANVGYARSYALDDWTAEAERLIQQLFQCQPKVFMVPTGTGANVLALKIACRRHESVICTDIAHLNYQESGAAESIVGCKLLSVPHQGGKLTVESVKKALHRERAFGKHSTSPRVLTLTQPTEFGTVYTLEELEAFSKLCREEKLLLHIDGSRIFNAVASLETSFVEMFGKLGVDLFSLGGTKNGLMCAEALVIFNPMLQEGSDYIHKQTLQLLSKTRYISAQFIPFFQNELWRKLALNANQKAKEIGEIIGTYPQLALSYPVETNQIFFSAPSSWIAPILDRVYCLLWNKEKNEIRMIASWNTSDEDVKGVKNLLEGLKDKK